MQDFDNQHEKGLNYLGSHNMLWQAIMCVVF